jgi:hypothetical protein
MIPYLPIPLRLSLPLCCNIYISLTLVDYLIITVNNSAHLINSGVVQIWIAALHPRMTRAREKQKAKKTLLV